MDVQEPKSLTVNGNFTFAIVLPGDWYLELDLSALSTTHTTKIQLNFTKLYQDFRTPTN
eukprot:TRINITY_DN10394_c0_g1_i1.p1 TRINITY_DN10394_c0_g1~~TRINITY_DN10394_c0_g1_i1.p1  ORF type:complete len:59 (-),score=1.48 TRINITY_DN10394_c0_g1_i1:237-413(-)